MSKETFPGFSKSAISFLRDLKANNTREWFNENKRTYEKELKIPASAFTEEMVGELEGLTNLSHTSKIYRIHRDVRFSKDKTPYNTHLHIGFTPRSNKATPPCWFFGLDTEKLTLGAGTFAFDKADLERFRARISGPDGTKFAKLLSGLEGKGVRISQPELKRVPSGYPKDHAQEEHLRRKGLTTWIDLGDPDLATREDLILSCRSSFEKMKPVVDWLAA